MHHTLHNLPIKTQPFGKSARLLGVFFTILLFLACETESPDAQSGIAITNNPELLETATDTQSLDGALSEERPPYNRTNWKHWSDDDGDCQDTRQEVLIAESLTEVTFEDSRNCRVESGVWYDVYSGQIYVAPSNLDVDHFIPLAHAHNSGGWKWSPEQKRLFANDLSDPDSLVAVSAGANRSKGASGPSNWKPPNEDAWCAYAAKWSRLKAHWGLDASEAESRAISEMINSCEGDRDRNWPIADSIDGIQLTDEQSTSERNVASTPIDSSEDRDCGDFSTWHLAREFFVVNGGPTTDHHRLDGDNDGIPCESLPGAP